MDRKEDREMLRKVGFAEVEMIRLARLSQLFYSRLMMSQKGAGPGKRLRLFAWSCSLLLARRKVLLPHNQAI